MNEEEIAHLRSYLSSQSMRRTPAQLIEMLRSAFQEFLQVLESIPNSLFRRRPTVDEWSAGEIVEHVQAVVAVYECAICTAIEYGEQPERVYGAIEPRLQGAAKERLLMALAASFERLQTVVLQAEPDAHLNITWDHFELGSMHWREWLLFVRIHLIEHIRQLQALVSKASK